MEESSLKFIADECFSPVLVSILNKLGEKSVVHLKRHFPEGTNDEDWIPTATTRGYVCVTLDRRMLTAETIAPFFKQAKARVVFIGSHLAGLRLWDQALWFLKYWRNIKKRAAGMEAGDLVKVLARGRIVDVAPRAESGKVRPRRDWKSTSC